VPCAACSRRSIARWVSRSVAEPRASHPETLSRLEDAVGRALARIDALQGELTRTGRRADDLDDVLAGITGGDLAPSALLERLRDLEEENADLHRRLAAGREGVERLLAKIRFLEEQR
jgi:hypothetical protein